VGVGALQLEAAAAAEVHPGVAEVAAGWPQGHTGQKERDASGWLQEEEHRGQAEEAGGAAEHLPHPYSGEGRRVHWAGAAVEPKVYGQTVQDQADDEHLPVQEPRLEEGRTEKA
jgi:hypothetical protein